MLRTKERTRIRWHSSVNPHAVIVPSSIAWLMERKAKQVRTLAALKTVVRVSVALGMLALLMIHVTPALALQAPPVPQNEKICGSNVLTGPSSAPGGAVVVAAGDNSAQFQNPLPPNTTYYFATGTHTFATGLYGPYNSIGPGNGDVFIGAPGAILDGSAYNHYAFAGAGNNVTIEYLTIQDYNAPGGDAAVETNQGEGWVVQYDTIQNNLPGAGVYLGTNDTVQYSCLTENGAYGWGAYSNANVSPLTGGVVNPEVIGNEISYNNVCNWEHFPGFPITPPSGCGTVGNVGCGCSGSGKFWETLNSVFDDNYDHDNYANGPWWDTNNAGAQVEGNYFQGELGTAVTMEIGYNYLISGNIFVRNAFFVGTYNPGFPSSAIYLNSSGSDSRVASNFNTVSDVTDNGFYDNWGGVVLYETADRFCSSIANTSTGTCTLVNPSTANSKTCQNTPQPVPPSMNPAAPPVPQGRRTGAPPRGGTTQGQNFGIYITRQPYYSDCRWKTQNVSVQGNLFEYTPSNIPSCTLAFYCGFNGLFSNYGVTPPYLAYSVANALTYTQNDLYSGNTYCGPWVFDTYIQGSISSFATWQAAPSSQDLDSTMNGASCYGTAPFPVQPGPVNRTIIIPIKIGGGSR